MANFTEVITNAATGETTTRSFTAEETAATEAAHAAALTAARSGMSLSFAQLLIGLVAEQWITEEEGEAWISGILPASVVALIATFPADRRFAAKARALRPSEVLRLDSLVVALGANQGKTEEELDVFFRKYAQVI